MSMEGEEAAAVYVRCRLSFFNKVIASLPLKIYSKFVIILLERKIVCMKLNFMKIKMESLK